MSLFRSFFFLIFTPFSDLISLISFLLKGVVVPLKPSALWHHLSIQVNLVTLFHSFIRVCSFISIYIVGLNEFSTFSQSIIFSFNSGLHTFCKIKVQKRIHGDLLKRQNTKPNIQKQYQMTEKC